jgi:hypothetical protein
VRNQWVVVFCLALCGVACGDDETVAGAPDAGNAMGGEGGTTGGAGGTTGGAGGTTGGAGGTTGGAGGTTGGTGGTAGTAGMEPEEDGGVEADAGDEEPNLPDDGNELSTCAKTADCNGDDLVCAVFGTFGGYCAQDCTEQTDCEAIGGIDQICDNNDRCVTDCSEEGSDGDCPENMECAEITTSPISDPIFRCQYPEPKNNKIYEACDFDRGDADCKGDLICNMFPGLTDPRVAICAAGCMEASECDDLGSDATPICDPAPLSPFDGICALECEADEDCPADMACADVDLVLKRCIFEN